ncbi:hypothetical protein FWC31_03510 [Candidatus Saccharibacteria bacterium]|nr:hypothetical protein [Candidatus Saccharibacteria bacterium]
MSNFRGQYMDMVDSSSDVTISNKLNRANVKTSPAAILPKSEQEISTNDEITKTAPEIDNIDINADATDDYGSPFLSGVEVEKRPLGGSPIENTRQFFGINDDADDKNDSFDINKLVDLSDPALPADDGGEGELQPALPSGDEEADETAIVAEPELNPEPTPVSRAAIVNTMLTPQYKAVKTTNLPESSSPFAHASDVANIASAKKARSVWPLILLFVMMALAGVAAGALIYLMME